MSVFKLPDLGEGLHEAEIAAWHVQAGEDVETGDPLVSVETDKAIVEVPSPQAGRILRVWGAPGDRLGVGSPLVEFEGEEELAGKAEATAAHEAARRPAAHEAARRPAPDEAGAGAAGRGARAAARMPARREGGRARAQREAPTAPRADSGTVVGRVEATQRVLNEAATPIARAGGIRATPAVRALARQLNVDLALVTPTGRDDTVTATDVRNAAEALRGAGPYEPLHGVRRVMARSMAQAHAEVVPVTVVDDADIDAWPPSEPLMLRLVRAIVAGCRAEPALNAWFDGRATARCVLEKIDLGIAMDTPDGLFVPVLRDVARRDAEELLTALEALKSGVRQRTIPPEEMRGCTFTLSNFGTFGGRYADPVVVPPTVAILGAGRRRKAVVPVDGRPAVHVILPLSLTFDHRAVTGGEATRFLAAVIGDLEHGR
ncbi:MAG TPA: dihydrolipoamide acetyltransferase family protein [Gammaproteobacteria bacterium]|nr:dihydrolipoamide acetyltransferase family protein [Gammaproteobacteria bacterium]